MDEQARAAFIVSQAACMQAQLAAMQAQNRIDQDNNRPDTYQPHQFESLPDQYQLGHNAVVSYLMGGN